MLVNTASSFIPCIANTIVQLIRRSSSGVMAFVHGPTLRPPSNLILKTL
jgi:hypothetical protein